MWGVAALLVVVTRGRRARGERQRIGLAGRRGPAGRLGRPHYPDRCPHARSSGSNSALCC